MRKLLLQLDSSRLPSVFDRVVAYDGGADEVMSYGSVVETDVRDLIHGCIFTRGPKDLKNTAVFVGGADMAVGEQLLAAATKAMFKPFTVSAMLDSNGSNTTAVAAVAKMVKAVGDVRGKRVDRKSTRLNSSHGYISYAVFCLKKKKKRSRKRKGEMNVKEYRDTRPS